MINSVTSDNQNSIGGIYQQNGGNLNLNTPRGVNKKTVSLHLTMLRLTDY
jgi:hypothetical protein